MFIIGVDLGQAGDYTAISVIEANDTGLLIRHLDRLPLGMPYPEQVEHITKLFNMVHNPVLVIDKTGVGRPVFDLLTMLNPIGLTITGGNDERRDGKNWNVPKRDLIHGLVIAFQNGNIKISSALPHAETLIRELTNFKLKVNIKTGHDSYEAWREGVHDDLVLSVAMAVHVAKNLHKTRGVIVGPTFEQKNDPNYRPRSYGSKNGRVIIGHGSG